MPTIQLPREDPLDVVAQLFLGAFAWDRRALDMEVDVELVVVDPHRRVDVEGQECNLLPVTWHQVEPRFDLPHQRLVPLVVALPGTGLKDGDTTDVHMGVAGLEVEERRIQRAESLSGH